MKSTTVAEASRRDAHNGKDRHSLKDALQQLEQEQSARTTRKLQLETEIMAINNRFKGGRHFDNDEYQRILARQQDIKVALKEIEAANREFRIRKVALKEDLSNSSDDGQHKMASNALLKQILAELVSIRKLLSKTPTVPDAAPRLPDADLPD